MSTIALLATGIVLIVEKPGDGLMLLLHKASFVVWVGAMSVHVLGHIVKIPGLTTPDLRGDRTVSGSMLRLGLVAATVVGGAIFAVATLPLATPWVHWASSK